MKIAVGCDHGGYKLKEHLKGLLQGQGHEVLDVGTYSDESCDYPDFAAKAAHAVAGGSVDLGILTCGTGLGMALAANKVKGIRAITCSDTFSAKMSREHNNANILCLGERVVGFGLADMITEIWLQTEFAGGRHARRVDKLMALEAE